MLQVLKAIPRSTLLNTNNSYVLYIHNVHWSGIVIHVYHCTCNIHWSGIVYNVKQISMYVGYHVSDICI